MKKLISSLCGLLFLFTVNGAYAAIVSVGGDIALITAPTSVEPGMLESSSTIWAFSEQQSYTLSADLAVDDLAGTSGIGTIAAGTTVNSYFLHADPVGTSTDSSDVMSITGTITFDAPILGLIWSGVSCNNCPVSNMYLDSSDYLGATGTSYPTGGLGRGYEIDDFYAINGTQDFVTISSDGYSLSTVSSAAQPLFSDQIRVVTAVVPLPLPVWMMASGLMVLFGVARKKRI